MKQRNGTTMTLLLEYLDEQEPKSLKLPIDILAWSWGSAGPKALQELSLTKYIGVESPHIMKMISTQQKIKQVTMTAENENTITLVLKNAYFTHQSMGGSGGEERLTENVTLAFSEVEMRTSFVISEVTQTSKASVSNEE